MKEIDEAIKNKVAEILATGTMPEIKDIVETDNLGEVVEKLIIVHIRTWMLEDAAGEATMNGDDLKLAAVKKKIDICFKQKRPKLVEAINRMVTNAIVTGKPLTEDSVKLYKGVDK